MKAKISDLFPKDGASQAQLPISSINLNEPENEFDEVHELLNSGAGEATQDIILSDSDTEIEKKRRKYSRGKHKQGKRMTKFNAFIQQNIQTILLNL